MARPFSATSYNSRELHLRCNAPKTPHRQQDNFSTALFNTFDSKIEPMSVVKRQE